MAKQRKKRKPDVRQQLERDLESIKMLLVLLVNKFGVEQKKIAEALGVSESTLSKMLNPKKYKS